MTKKQLQDIPWSNLVEMFFDQAKKGKRKTFLHQRSNDGWKAISWQQAAKQVEDIAKSLYHLGIQPGDRVAIVSENRYEWGLIDLAIMAMGGITVPAYTTNTTGDHRHIIEDSGANIAFISNQALLKTFLPAAIDAPKMRHIITLDSVKFQQNPDLNLYRLGNTPLDEDKEEFDIKQHISKIKHDDIACLIYTSGTGGAPKGVMLEHKALLSNCQGVEFIYHQIKKFSFFSILPLSHAFEHTVGFLAPIYYNGEVYYPNGIENLLSGLTESNPGVLLAVPRIYEVFKSRIEGQLRKAPARKKAIYNKALALGLKRVNDETFSFIEKYQYALLRKLVQKKIQKTFGNVQLFVSGGAPLDPELGKWLMAMEFPIIQGYGQTEASPMVSANYPKSKKYYTVGPKLENIEVKLSADNELLVKGELLMRGYWNNRRSTAETLVNGWLHTGDIASIDDEGHLMITGRKKDIIILTGGDNISPTRLESLMSLEEEIGQAILYGDKRNYLVALVNPDADWLEIWAKENGKENNLEELCNDKELKSVLAGVIKQLNKRTTVAENIRKFIIAPEYFTIENSFLTPTMKLRRQLIIEKYKPQLDELY
ncbi:MAG: AMP-dependent synthetase/ligase [Alphaproteobacteria bacterium]